MASSYSLGGLLNEVLVQSQIPEPIQVSHWSTCKPAEPRRLLARSTMIIAG